MVQLHLALCAVGTLPLLISSLGLHLQVWGTQFTRINSGTESSRTACLRDEEFGQGKNKKAAMTEKA